MPTAESSCQRITDPRLTRPGPVTRSVRVRGEQQQPRSVHWVTCVQGLEIPATDPARADSDNRDSGSEQPLRPGRVGTNRFRFQSVRRLLPIECDERTRDER